MPRETIASVDAQIKAINDRIEKIKEIFPKFEEELSDSICSEGQDVVKQIASLLDIKGYIPYISYDQLYDLKNISPGEVYITDDYGNEKRITIHA